MLESLCELRVSKIAARDPQFLYTGPSARPSDVEEVARRLSESLQDEQASSSAASEVTCCVIKPHALQQTGKVLRSIVDSGLTIGAMQSFRMTNPTATEFLEVYRTVLKEYPQVRR